MLILLFGVIFHIICGIYATNTANLDYCVIQKQEFCASRPHLLCNSSSHAINDKMDTREKGYLLNLLKFNRDNVSHLHWDDELEVMAKKLPRNINPNTYCMSSRNFVDVNSVVFKMYCIDYVATCTITEDPFAKHDGDKLNIGCDTKIVIHNIGNETHNIICTYNISNRLTSDEYIITDISNASGILKFNMYAVWLVLGATALIVTAI